MSLFESKDSEGIISLNELFKGNHSIEAVSRLEIPQIARLICRGGWPGAVTFPETEGALAREYADMIVEEDIIRVDGVERNSHRVRLVLHSLARNISTLTSGRKINDAGNDKNNSQRLF